MRQRHVFESGEQRVRKVRNKAQKLKPGSDSDEQLAALKEENARLKEQLARFAQ